MASQGVSIFKGPHAHGGCPLGAAFGGRMNVFPTRTVRLAEQDETVARQRRLIVHSSVHTDHAFWRDSDVQRRRHAPAAALCEPPSVEESDALAQGFSGTDDPEFANTALQAWVRAKRDALAQHKQPVPEQASVRRSAYVCFADHVVMNKLEVRAGRAAAPCCV